MGEQVSGEDAARRASRGDLLGGQRGVQLADSALVPGGRILNVDDLADGGGRTGAMLRCSMSPDPAGLGWRSSRSDAAASWVRARLSSRRSEMGGDELVAGVDVRRGDDGPDVLEGHLQRAEPPDHLGGRDLVGGIAAVTSVRVDVGAAPAGRPDGNAASVLTLRWVAREKSPMGSEDRIWPV